MYFKDEDTEILRNIITHRRDVRGNQFLPALIPDDVLNKLLFAFEHAPSVGYSQPWQMVIIKDPITKQNIKEIFDIENLAAVEKFSAERSARRSMPSRRY